MINKHNQYETEIHNELWRINLYMNNGVSNWHISSIFLTKMSFMHVFHFDTGLLTFKQPKLFSTNSSSEMERCEKRASHLFKMRKWNINWNIKVKYVTDVFLSVRSSSMKDYTCH